MTYYSGRKLESGYKSSCLGAHALAEQVSHRDFPPLNTDNLYSCSISLFPSGPDRMIRAARHYERAGQILTRMSVATARTFIQGVSYPVPPLNGPVTVMAPARIDLAGGWSDTPPQSFEWGGSVTTLAITVNGEV